MFGGDGGFVETSGKQILAITQAADVSAPFGKPGQWLLDPYDIEIVDSLDNAKLAGGNKVDVAIINAALNNGTSVKIQSNNNGEGEGNILLSSAIIKTSGGDSTLTLNAAGGITINKLISSTSGALSLDLIAATGVVLNESLILNGGSVTLNSNETFDRPNFENPGRQNIVQTTHISGVSQGSVPHVSGATRVGSFHISGNQNKVNLSANHGNEIVLGDFFNKLETVQKSYIDQKGNNITYSTFTSKGHLDTSGGDIIFKDQVKVNADIFKRKRTLNGLNNFIFTEDYFSIKSGGGKIIFADNVESVTGGLRLDSDGGKISLQKKVNSAAGYFSFDSDGGHISFADDVNTGSNGFSISASGGNVIFKKSLNSGLLTSQDLYDPTKGFYVFGGNITFQEIGNLRPFKGFYISSSSTVKFLGKSNFRGHFNVTANNGIDILDNMKITALSNSIRADAISFNADSDQNGVGSFRTAKNESFSKTGYLHITAAGFALSHKIKGEHGSIDIYDTKIKKSFNNSDVNFYAHISGRGSVNPPSASQTSLNGSSQITKASQSNAKNSTTANISGNKTNINQTILTQTTLSKIENNSSSISTLSNSNSPNKNLKSEETPEQKAIKAAIAAKNAKLDAQTKEIRNRLVAIRANVIPAIDKNGFTPKTLQQKVTGLWTRLVGNKTLTNNIISSSVPPSNSPADEKKDK